MATEEENTKTAAQTLNFRTGFLLHDVSRLRKKVIDQQLKPLKITRSQWWVLANLSRHPDGITQTHLASIMDVGKVSLGGLIDRLEETGYVERRPDLVDRRTKKVFMTEAGQKLLEDIKEVAATANESIMQGISKDQHKLLDGMLQQIKQNLIDMSKAGS